MPLYEFACDACRMTFDVSRPMAEAGQPAYCPECGEQGRRLISLNPVILRPWGYSLKPGHPDYYKHFADEVVRYQWQYSQPQGGSKRNESDADRDPSRRHSRTGRADADQRPEAVDLRG